MFDNLLCFNTIQRRDIFYPHLYPPEIWIRRENVVLSTNEFASHIHSHGSPFDRATINGVLMAACDCLVELVKESKKVQLGDLGTFYLSAESENTDSESGVPIDEMP